MRIAVVLVPLALGIGTTGAFAGVDVNINIGSPIPHVIVPGPVVTIDRDVPFVFSQPLGFYVAVGVPYDLFFVRDTYYLSRDGRWFRARHSHGPWVRVRSRELPPSLRRHRLERIRDYRDAEYDVYRRDPEHYRGKHFRTEKEAWKEHRKEEKEHWKEEKRERKEERKDVKRAEKEERKGDKEGRKHHRGKHDKD